MIKYCAAKTVYRLFGHERVYLPLCNVAETPFHTQGDQVHYIYTFQSKCQTPKYATKID